jgi:hypothetical protein
MAQATSMGEEFTPETSYDTYMAQNDAFVKGAMKKNQMYQEQTKKYMTFADPSAHEAYADAYASAYLP